MISSLQRDSETGSVGGGFGAKVYVNFYSLS